MRAAAVYMTENEKNVIALHIGSTGYDLCRLLKKSLINANERPLESFDKNIFVYRPVVYTKCISTWMDDNEFYRIVHRPSVILGCTQHSYVSAVFFDYLKKTLGIDYSIIKEADPELVQFKSFILDEQYYNALIKYKQRYRISYKDWLQKAIENNSDLVEGNSTFSFSKTKCNPRPYRQSNKYEVTMLVNRNDHLIIKDLANKYDTYEYCIIEYLINKTLMPDFNESKDSKSDIYEFSDQVQSGQVKSTKQFTHNTVNDIEFTDQNRDFYNSLVTKISVYDPELKVCIDRTFKNHVIAEKVYSLLQQGKLDFVNSKIDNKKYMNVNVDFSDSQLLDNNTIYSDDVFSFLH